MTRLGLDRLVQGIAGLVFGLGLVVSGMIDPAKVLNFLDFAGTWDPSLAFVMAGAVAIAFVGFRVAGGRARPILAERFHWPVSRAVDPRVIVGPAVFGIGWGLSGFCPGPAVAALGLLAPGTFVFVGAMLIGMAIARALTAPRVPQDQSHPVAGTRP
ncbi:YeeE/YedE family protein [Segnochrobactrum spirostomi]|uniref:YeeE/YedE family protein n=1 Tax=Segnochrobactrum spirostomi TaxID=2608987 RepID=A0A6A7Y733_9HYPH|nr:YeeE/YedE family protein [Segnochrobactrum spirostomi]MQT14636.1 YeeE/YedE family protein [Segnochrobactrum spirostomi]